MMKTRSVRGKRTRERAGRLLSSLVLLFLLLFFFLLDLALGSRSLGLRRGLRLGLLVFVRLLLGLGARGSGLFGTASGLTLGLALARSSGRSVGICVAVVGGGEGTRARDAMSLEHALVSLLAVGVMDQYL
jgi:hypothetical protein